MAIDEFTDAPDPMEPVTQEPTSTPAPTTSYPTPEPAGYEPVEGTVETPQTVAGQMTGLLESDSDYMKRAETKGRQEVASRGLLNTSMGVGASQAAAIDAALPIAQQDASTFTQQSLANQDVANKAGMFNADFENQQYFREQDVGNVMKVNEQQNAATLERQQLDIDNKNYLANLDRDMQLKMQELDLSQEDRETFSNYISENNQQYQINQTKIATDPELSSSGKRRALADLRNVHESNIVVMSDLYGVDVSWNFDEPAEGTSAAATIEAAAAAPPPKVVYVDRPTYEDEHKSGDADSGGTGDGW